MSDETNVLLTTDKYVLLGYDERGEIRRYSDGTLRDENGRARTLVAGLDEHAITSETAHQYHAMRKAKILRAIEARIQDVTKTNAPAEAIAHIVGKRAEIAMSDNSRTGNEAAKIVLAAVDAYQTKTTENAQVTRHEYTVDDDTRQLLHAMIQERRDNHTSKDDWAANDGEILAENIE